MKKIILVTILAALGFTAPVIASAQTKVGFVDTQKAIQESKAGKKAKSELEKEVEKKKKEIEKKDADLKKMREDIEKKKAVLSEEAFNKRAQEFQEEMMKQQEFKMKTSQEFQKKENELLAPIADKMKKIIEKIAKDKGFSMVIQTNPIQQNVIWASAENDLTADVVSAMDK